MTSLRAPKCACRACPPTPRPLPYAHGGGRHLQAGIVFRSVETLYKRKYEAQLKDLKEGMATEFKQDSDKLHHEMRTYKMLFKDNQRKMATLSRNYTRMLDAENAHKLRISNLGEIARDRSQIARDSNHRPRREGSSRRGCPGGIVSRSSPLAARDT